ncbi:hypothetical protein K470DRAFT_254486 [Piedraia hortae CBS 480.64]|uniref:AHC1-like C2H2 zinc-finger domain-containing protein n=1 Tax=Piedraia hortae CBS 480.64 TaxID=1314780 RepID=A0A6A7C9C3_9PEZI|nr:hypothetical protein K470DRAFT_254486 [Piedraia hortae CBS 480.64]
MEHKFGLPQYNNGFQIGKHGLGPFDTKRFDLDMSSKAKRKLPDEFSESPISKRPYVPPIKLEFQPSHGPVAGLLTPLSAATNHAGHLTHFDNLALAQIIENEFNWQILHKHNELRLIEQELAKCQVALEQLRRCELVPFPGTQGLSMAVTKGLGPWVIPSSGQPRPSHPPPWGVTDGPYSRHYQQWLLPDARFDSTVATVGPADDLGTVPARSTRNAAASRRLNPATHMPMTAKVGDVSGNKVSPLILRRSTDGKFVKLMCNHCDRSNFSNIQGFLNHCRLAHKVDYKSHDAAAVDCGLVVDEGEAARLRLLASMTPKEATSRSAAATSRVHPLNLPTARTNISPAVQAMGSTQAPRLSAFLAKRGFSANLDDAINHAKYREPSEAASPVQPSPTTFSAAGLVSRRQYSPPASTTMVSPDQSPHTADSYPGLVSDREDDDHGSGSEYEAPMAEAPSVAVRRTCVGSMELTEEHVEQEDGVMIRRSSLGDSLHH